MDLIDPQAGRAERRITESLQRLAAKLLRMVEVYTRIWEYEVAEADIGAFLVAYGADGDWAQLFRRGPGYLGTELYRGVEKANVFLTVDRWRDETAWHAFLEEWSETYDGLGKRLGGLSSFQRLLHEGSA